jgi:hypothetical protein
MAHAQYAAGGLTIRDTDSLALSWVTGWCVKPFSALPRCIGACLSALAGENRSVARRALIGVAVTVPLLLIILPLLAGADQVFGFYLGRALERFNLASFLPHAVAVALASMLLYSFIWNLEFAESAARVIRRRREIDAVVGVIVLGAVCLVYIVFCAVAYTYLFARTGLPEGMLREHSQYIREGFYQTVAVCALNLVIFGVFLRHSRKRGAISALLWTLLALTGVMLFSGAVRLNLYVDVYGMTWLRLLSGWFMIYLAAAILICAAKLLRPRLPAPAICLIVLLGWFVALGFANPDKLLERYNNTHDFIGKGIVTETLDLR